MLKSGLIIVFFAGLFIFSGCKKEEASWTYFVDSELSDWTGDYVGAGDYFNGVKEETTPDVPTTIIIENTSGNVLKTSIDVQDQFSTYFISTKNDDKYYYEVPGSNKSLSLTLSKRESELKLSGTVKLYHYVKDSLVVDQSISFNTFRTISE